jgi:hypothetical protein
MLRTAITATIAFLIFRQSLAEPKPPIVIVDPITPILKRIATVEGWNRPRSLVRRLHNPGALRFAHQRGATRGLRGFAKFTTDQDGWLASWRDYTAKRRLGMSLEQIARKRCGPGDDVERYVRLLATPAE